jgi:TRAP-type uncharacterized transport system fused permease subunit
VCGAIFIAAGMAEANWVKTANLGLKLSFAAFLLPFLFALDPSLVLIGSPWQTMLSTLLGLIAITMLSAGFMGFLRSDLSRLARLALLTGGCLCLVQPWWLNLIGIGLGIWIWFSNEKCSPDFKVKGATPTSLPEDETAFSD